MARAIRHFTHQGHPLTEFDKATEYLCHGCGTLGIGKRYRCDQCDFNLHGHCAGLSDSETITSSHLHPGDPATHVLRLELRRAQGASRHTRRSACRVCGDEVDGLVYSCRDCGFDVHPLCSLLPAKVRHEDHKHHELTFVDDPSNPRPCNFCALRCEFWRYRCEPCGLDLHPECVRVADNRPPTSSKISTPASCDRYCSTRSLDHQQPAQQQGASLGEQFGLVPSSNGPAYSNEYYPHPHAIPSPPLQAHPSPYPLPHRHFSLLHYYAYHQYRHHFQQTYPHHPPTVYPHGLPYPSSLVHPPPPPPPPLPPPPPPPPYPVNDHYYAQNGSWQGHGSGPSGHGHGDHGASTAASDQCGGAQGGGGSSQPAGRKRRRVYWLLKQIGLATLGVALQGVIGVPFAIVCPELWGN